MVLLEKRPRDYCFRYTIADGDIDCKDAGCFDKPTYQSEDTDTDQTEPLGYLYSLEFVTEWGSIEDYVYKNRVYPH